jgi:hypothetical protein
MDHITIPHGEARAAPTWLEVPVYAPEMEYERGTFFGYLRRIDWTVQDILDGQTSESLVITFTLFYRHGHILECFPN